MKLLLILVAALSAMAQEEPSKLTARQLFFTARPPVKETPALPAPAPTPPPPVAVVKKAVPAKKQPPKPKPVEQAKAPVAPVAPEPAEPPTPVTPPPATPAAPVEPVKSQAVVIPYLGLRYSLLQDKPGG